MHSASPKETAYNLGSATELSWFDYLHAHPEDVKDFGFSMSVAGAVL